jgi:hypothetical protein
VRGWTDSAARRNVVNWLDDDYTARKIRDVRTGRHVLNSQRRGSHSEVALSVYLRMRLRVHLRLGSRL